MRGNWQIRLALRAKQNRLLWPFAFAILGLGYYAAGALAGVQKEWAALRALPRQALRFSALALSFMLLFSQLSASLFAFAVDGDSESWQLAEQQEEAEMPEESAYYTDGAEPANGPETEEEANAPANEPGEEGLNDLLSGQEEENEVEPAGEEGGPGEPGQQEFGQNTGEGVENAQEEGEGNEENFIITSFATLEAGVLWQEYPVDTTEDEIVLPPTLEVLGGFAEPGETPEQGLEVLSLPVEWQALTPYEAEQAGDYVFVPVLAEALPMAAGAQLPSIVVTLAAGNPAEIYVDGGLGDDSMGNGTQATPYKTLGMALNEAADEATIYVSGTVTETASLKIGPNIKITIIGDGSATIIRGGPGALFDVEGEREKKGNTILTLNNLTLRGSALGKGSINDYTSLVSASSESLVYLNDCTLTGNTPRNSYPAAVGGAVYSAGGSTVEMNGGQITGNSANEGGAVYTQLLGSFVMNSGTISGNNATTGGGIYNNSPGFSSGPAAEIAGFIFVGGDIYDNTSTNTNGTDVYVATDGTAKLKAASGQIGRLNGSSGFYWDRTEGQKTSQVSVEATGATIYTAHGVGDKLAAVGPGLNGNEDTAAQMFIYYTNTKMEGYHQEGLIYMSGEGAYRVVSGTKTVFTDTLALAIQAAKTAGVDTAVYQRWNVDEAGSEPLMDANLHITLSSDSRATTPYTYNNAGVDYNLRVAGGKLTISNLNITESASEAVALVSGGELALGEKATIENTQAGKAAVVANAGAVAVVGGHLKGAVALEIDGGGGSMLSGQLLGEAAGLRLKSGSFSVSGGSVQANSGPGVEILGGSLTLGGENTTVNGSSNGVLVRQQNIFTPAGLLMQNGSVSGGTSAAVSLVDGAVQMNDGLLSGTASSGAAVEGGSFTMAGGTVETAAADNAGLAAVNLNDGLFTMAGGTVKGGNNDGVFITGGKFKLQSGEIGQSARGVYIEGAQSSFEMTGGAIEKNTGRGLTVAGGTAAVSGGFVGGENETAANGGGVLVQGGSFSLSGSGQVAYNHSGASNGGGVLVNGGEFSLQSGGSVHHNQSMGNGGGVAVGSSGKLTLAGGSVHHNQSTGNGGGVYAQAGFEVAAAGGEIADNTAAENGGGLWVSSASFTPGQQLAVSGNKAVLGGGVYLQLAASENFALFGCAITGNEANTGGGLYAAGGNGLLTLSNIQLNGNTLTTGPGTVGSGIYLAGPSLQLEGNMLSLQDGVARSAAEVIYLNSTFWGAGLQVLLEKAEGFNENDILFNNQTIADDWTANLPTTNNSDKGGYAAGFAAINGSGERLMGIYLPDDDTIVLKSIAVELQIYGSGGTVEKTSFHPTLALALENASTQGAGQKAVALLLKNIAEGNLAIGGNIDLTLTSKDENTAAVLSRSGSGNWITVQTGSTLRLGSVVLSGGEPGTGPMLYVNGGTAVLGEKATLKNNGYTGAGAAVYVNAGTLHMEGADITTGHSGSSTVALSGSSAVLQLKSGNVGTLERLNTNGSSPKVLIDSAFTTAAVEMVGTYSEGPIGFIDCPDSLKAAVAPCFTAFTQDGLKLAGDVVSNVLVWSGIRVELTVGTGQPVGYSSLEKAVANTQAGINAIQLLVDLSTTPVTIESGKTVSITHANTVGTISRGAAGNLFTVEEGAALTLTDIALDGKNASYQSGSLFYVEGSLTLNGGTLEKNNSGAVSGSALHLAKGQATLSAVTIKENQAAQHSGIYVNDGNLLLNDVIVTQNLAGGSATAQGSGLYLAGGSITLGGNMQLGATLLDNNLVNNSGSAIMLDGLANTALVHVGGSASEGGLVATKLTNSALSPQAAQSFRHIGEELLIGAQSGDNVLWAAHTAYPAYGWNGDETSFLSDADGSSASFLYLIVNGKALTRGTDYTLSYDTTTTTITLDPAWVAANKPAETTRGYEILMSVRSGYTGGISRIVGLSFEGAAESFYTTLGAAVAAAPSGKAATLTLYGSVQITGAGGNGLITVENKTLTLRSDPGRASGAPAYSVQRGTTGDLFTVNNASGSLSFTDVVVDGNKASYPTASGALLAVSNGEARLLAGAVLQNNSSGTDGGGVYIGGGTLQIDGGSISGNSTSERGGGVYAAGGALELVSGEIGGNSANGDGGGVYVNNINALVKALGGEISGNESLFGSGGGIYVKTGEFTASGTAIKDNDAGERGGGIYLAGGTLRLEGGALSGNTAPIAGGILYKALDAEFVVKAGVLNPGNGVVFDAGGVTLASPMTVAKSFNLAADAQTTAILLEGQLDTAGNTILPMGSGDKVASYEADFASGLSSAEYTAARKTAARKFYYTNGVNVFLRGQPQNGNGVVLAPANAVGLILPGQQEVLHSSIEDAVAEIPGNSDADVIVKINVLIYESVRIDGGRRVTLTSESAVTATRDEHLLGDLFTLEGQNTSLTIRGGDGAQTLTIDGNCSVVADAQGSLLRVKGGASLAVEANAWLQNNRNTGANGGGIYVEQGGRLSFKSGLLSGNTAANGGGIYVEQGGRLSFEGGVLRGNTAANGGGIYSLGALNLSGGEISANTADANGGGIYIGLGSPTMAGGTITQNTAPCGSGVFLAAGAKLLYSGGLLGVNDTDNGLTQHLAQEDSAPGLAVCAEPPASARLNLESRQVASSQAKAYEDNQPAALIAAGFTGYQQHLDSAAYLHDVGANSLYTVLNPTADGYLLRKNISYTEPLYLEEASGLGSDVRWETNGLFNVVDGLEVELGGSYVSLVPGTDFTVNSDQVALTRAFLDRVENGTYRARLKAGGSQTVETGFTVRAAAVAELSSNGTYIGGFRTLAGAVAAAPAGQSSTIALLADVPVDGIVVNGGRQLTIKSKTGAYTMARGGTGDLLSVSAGASLALENVLLDGGAPGTYANAQGSLVKVAGGTVVLGNGAVLQNNSNSTGLGGGVLVTGGTLQLSGGSRVTGNHAEKGGAVYLQAGTINATGGEIGANSAGQAGGGIYVAAGGSLVVGGAGNAFLLTGNTVSSGFGAGVYLEENAAFTQYGGQIGVAPAMADTTIDNGLYFHKNSLPVLKGSFAAAGNLNIEGIYDNTGDLWLPGRDVALAADIQDTNYPALANAANAIYYLINSEIFRAVAIPKANGGFKLTTVPELYECYALYRKLAADPDVFWRFGPGRGTDEVAKVMVGDSVLAKGTDYALASGSIVLTLQRVYLNTLKNGVYTVDVYLQTDAELPSYSYQFVVDVLNNPNDNNGDGDDGGGDDDDGGNGTGNGNGDGTGTGTGNGNGTGTGNGDGTGTGSGSGNSNGAGNSGTSGRPQTGDNAPLGLWLGAAGLSLLCFILLAVGLRKKKQGKASGYSNKS